MKLLNAGPLMNAGSGAHLKLINAGALIRSFTVPFAAHGLACLNVFSQYSQMFSHNIKHVAGAKNITYGLIVW